MQILSFDDPQALEQNLTGGKGVNLSRLSQAGFQVPPGFCVTTQAYDLFMSVDDLQERLVEKAKNLSCDDPLTLEVQTTEIRELILATKMPENIVNNIADAYRQLDEKMFVAVRSSGTAEDLEDASFAGQHDTYLDVLGASEVIDAVQRCWASLWTARATGYRHHNKFDHAEVQIAVVVQKMVQSDVSGVMFTGNPLTTANDEIVINSVWGLGEAMVQGMVTPDEIVVQMPNKTTPLRIIERTTGAKEQRIVRDQVTGSGVLTEDVPHAEQVLDTLDDTEALELAELGLKVQEYYDQFPQDIEWGMENGKIYLLQSRPITGVEFSWDTDVEAMIEQEDPIDAVWTRAFSDSIMNGIVTPSQYSTRFPPFSHRFFRKMHEDFGFDDLGAMRQHKFWKGEAYYNVRPEMEWVKRMVWPPMRPLFLDFVPQAWHQEVLDAPFDLAVFLGAMRHWHEVAQDTTPYGFPSVFKVWNKQRDDVNGKPYEDLRGMSDAELVSYCQKIIDIEGEWGDVIYAPYFATLRLTMAATWWIVGNWYDGDLNSTFSILVTGTRKRTGTQIENSGLQKLVEEIRESKDLMEVLNNHQDAEFFKHLESFDEGQNFLSRYQSWLAEFSHRGQADRDYYYARRSEDSSIDYRAFKIMLQAEPGHLEQREAELNVAREETAAKVRTHLEAQPNGAVKAMLFTTVHNLAIEYQEIRDDERFCPTDSIMHAYKRGALVLGERLHERGLLNEVDDVWFLADWELYDVVSGRSEMTPLLKTKIAARKRDGMRVLNKTADLPMHLQRNRAIDLDHAITEIQDGVYKGSPTSGGTVTAIARVLNNHSEMPRVSPGEILVTHSTDPGWNPVFSVISAVVVETGGMLSHASCLAREYGFPAVHLPNATKLIEDGAMITVDGHSGTVSIVLM